MDSNMQLSLDKNTYSKWIYERRRQKLNLAMLKSQTLTKDTGQPVWDLTWCSGLEGRKQVLIPA